MTTYNVNVLVIKPFSSSPLYISNIKTMFANCFLILSPSIHLLPLLATSPLPLKEPIAKLKIIFAYVSLHVLI